MKRLILLTAGVICSVATAFSQDYFYDNTRPIPVERDLSTVVVHLENDAAFEEFVEKAQQTYKLKKENAKYRMAVVAIPGNTQSDFSLKNAAAFEAIEIKDESFALQLNDGFNLWLGYEILFDPKAGVDIYQSELANELFYHNAKISTDRFGLRRITVSEPEASLSIANKLVESGLVNWAHPNFYANHTKFSDPLYSAQFQMNNTGQTISGATGQDDIDCDAPEAWEITTGSSNIDVAVIDDGVEDHPDLEDGSGNSRVLAGFTPSTDGNGTPIGGAAHGMACSGIVGASHNSIGVKGLAPEVNIRSVNIFEGTETVADLANAFSWAEDQGADVISNSWGYTSCNLSLSALNAAINSARLNGRDGNGCVIVFASGNSYESCVEYPANLSYVLGVGAVTNTGVHSNYSNTGPDLDLVAPSGPAPGQVGAGVRTIDREGFSGYSSGDYTNNFGGTSAACPLVSGAAALLLSFDQDLTESQVRTFLENTATDMGPSGFDNTYGHGRVNAYEALLAAGGGELNCNNTITSFPYTQGFESGIGLFTQGDNDDFDWSVNSGETDTDNSGPNSAFEGSNYLYIESSGPNYPNNSAAISTPCFDLTGLSTPTAYFEYHMYGSAIGELVLQARTDESSWTTIWSQNGDQGTQWLSAEVDLGTYSDSDNLKLRFSATTTTSFTGDIAIDNFSVEEFVEEPVLNCDATLSNFPYLLNFENGLQNWNQNQEDDFDWTVGSGPTPTFQTGPEAAAAGSNYLYIETSAPNYPNKSAAFTSPCLDISGLDNPTLYFNYHMFGTIGALEVEARDENGDWNTIWSLNGDQGNSWFLAEVALLEYLDNPGLKLRFTGSSANLFNGDIAIDQIEITEAGEESANAFCATNISDFPYSESFESGLGAWTQSNTDDFDWETTSGATPSMGTGPDAAYDESAYAFAESSAPNYPNKSARITSPCFDISALDEPAISFAFHMFGSNMGSLVLEARTEGSGWTQLWAENGNQGNTWNTEVFNLLDFAGSNEIKFRFTGTTAQGFTSDFSLDLIEIDEAEELEAEAACASPIAAFPYVQSFESGLENWSQSSEDNTDWTLNSGATPTFNTGPSSASDESQYLYLESSYPHYPQKTAIIESPCFDISSLSTPQIAFDYHMYGGAIGSLSLEILNDNQEWQTIWSESGDQSNLWNTAVAELSGFGSPETTALRFLATSGNGFTSDIAIDYIRIGSEFGEIEAVNCPPINFNATRIRSHGSNQDAGTHSISDGGYTILLENNAWKAAAFNYDVTEETVLELEFRSSSQGEIHGIGFDSEGNISADLTFQLYGTQSWGILNYNDYSAGDDWATYTIPVGDFYTGSFSRLIFVSDNDAGSGDESEFRNVKVYESGDCGIQRQFNEGTAGIPIYGNEPEADNVRAMDMAVYPNPASDRINVEVGSTNGEPYSIRVVDITGVTHLSRQVTRTTETFEIEKLGSGIYLIQLRTGNEVIATRRFVKTR